MENLKTLIPGIPELWADKFSDSCIGRGKPEQWLSRLSNITPLVFFILGLGKG